LHRDDERVVFSAVEVFRSVEKTINS